MNQSIKSFFQCVASGIFVGLFISVVNNVYAAVFIMATGIPVRELINFKSVTVASTVPAVLGAIIFWALCNWVDQPEKRFRWLAAVGVVVSLAGPLSPILPSGVLPPPGFVLLTIPMHIFAGILCMVLIPRFVR
ncbi:hypothetical protein EBR96_08490 [bacterium]|nr:hypothetical protein [bacterium]